MEVVCHFFVSCLGMAVTDVSLLLFIVLQRSHEKLFMCAIYKYYYYYSTDWRGKYFQSVHEKYSLNARDDRTHRVALCSARYLVYKSEVHIGNILDMAVKRSLPSCLERWKIGFLILWTMLSMVHWMYIIIRMSHRNWKNSILSGGFVSSVI